MTPPPSSTLALPPPPPNQDCTTLTCTEPLTYTPSRFTCGCVWPIQVKIRLSVALYTFFPLVSELAGEIVSSLSLDQSQVRIVGANAANQQLEKTIVLVNLVPLETKLNYSAAFSSYKKFWHRQIHINSFLLGAYEVLDVHYPGLPPSPPSIASNLAAIDGHPYPANNRDNDGNLLKPLGVNVQRRIKNRSNRSLLAAIVVSSITALIICASIAWVLTVRHRNSAPQLEEAPATPLSSFTKPSVWLLGAEKTGLSMHITRNATKNLVIIEEEEQLLGAMQLIGICTEDNIRCLVYELLPNGSVESHLQGVYKEISALDWPTRMKIPLGAARGLAYLHEDSSPCVIYTVTSRPVTSC